MGADRGQTDSSLLLDLEAFKLHIGFRPGAELTLHFDTPSRRFYLALIALVVTAMRAPARPKWIALAAHTDLLVAFNETVGAKAGSSDPGTLLRRIYRKWKTALPDLGNAPLFRVLGRHRPRWHEAGETAVASESQCDLWANLFEYRGSEEHVQLRLALENLGIEADEVELRFGALHGEPAWSAFVANLAPAAGGGEATVPAPPTAASPPRWRTIVRHGRPWALVAGLALIVAAGGSFVFGDRRDPPQAGALDEAKVYPVPALPVIAVLPFSGLGDEARDEQLAAGFGLEIVSALSRIPDLAVVALPRRAAAAAADGLAPGAGYVLQGSLGRAGDRLRVSVVLSDAAAGNPLWAERFDRTVGDLFEIQDEITLHVVTTLQARLTIGAHAQLWAKRTRNLDAYLKYLEAISLIARHSKAANSQALRVAAEVVARDPQYSRGHVALAQAHLWDILLRMEPTPLPSLTMATEAVRKAVELDPTDPTALGVLASCLLMAREHDLAVEMIERATALDPNAWDMRVRRGFILANAGRAADAVQSILSVRRTHPNLYLQPYYYLHLTIAYRLNGEYIEAIRIAEEAVGRLPDHLLLRLQLAAALVQAGRSDEARAHAAQALRIDPAFSLDRYRATLYYRDGREVEGLIEALRSAGLR